MTGVNGGAVGAGAGNHRAGDRAARGSAAPAPAPGGGPAAGSGWPDPAPAAMAAPEVRPGEGRHQWSAGTAAGPAAAARDDGFDPSDTGTWRVRDVVPGGESGRRTSTILRYLLGLLAVEHIRKLTRWAYAVPVAGALLLLIRPRWIGVTVLVLGLLLVAAGLGAVRRMGRLSLARRFRPVEDELRAAVEAGKANLRGELLRAGLPSTPWAIPLSVVRLSRGGARGESRSRLLDIEIDRILPRAQLDRALRILDEAAPSR